MAAQAEASVRLSLVDRISAPIRRIQARMAALSRGLGIDRIAASFGNLTTRIGGLGSALGATSGRFASLAGIVGLGAGGLTTVLYGVTKGVADVGAELTESSFKLGIGVEALQEYRYAAMMAGIEQDALTTAMQKLGINASAAANGNKGMADNFRALGVSVKDANGNMRDTESVLNDTFAALAKVEDPMRRNELAFRLFGKSGVDMVKMLADGEEGLIALRKEARRTGHVMSGNAAAMGDTFGDNVDRLMTRLEGLKLFLGVQLLPVMNELVTSVTDWVSANQELVRGTISDWVSRLATLLTDLMNPASEIRLGFAGMAESVANFAKGLAPVISSLGVGNIVLVGMAFAIGGPIMASFVAAGLALSSLNTALGGMPLALLSAGFDGVKSAATWLSDTWRNAAEAWNAAWARIVQAWSNFGATIMGAWEAYMTWGRGIAAAIQGWFAGIDLGAIASTIMGSFTTGATAAWGGVLALGGDIAEEVEGWFSIDLSSAGEGIMVPLSEGLQIKWASVANWFGSAVNGLVNAIPEWARGPLGIQVSGQPMTEADMASRARQDGQAAADRVPGAGWFDSQENKDSADQAKALAFLQAEGAALSRLRAHNAQTTRPGANLSAPGAALAAPSTVPMATPTVTAGTVTTESLTVPEPLLVHQPQAVDASYHADALQITVPPHMTAAQAESMILSVLAQHSKAHAERVNAAMGVVH